jgi:hypothetical protein
LTNEQAVFLILAVIAVIVAVVRKAKLLELKGVAPEVLVLAKSIHVGGVLLAVAALVSIVGIRPKPARLTVALYAFTIAIPINAALAMVADMQNKTKNPKEVYFLGYSAHASAFWAVATGYLYLCWAISPSLAVAFLASGLFGTALLWFFVSKSKKGVDKKSAAPAAGGVPKEPMTGPQDDETTQENGQ